MYSACLVLDYFATSQMKRKPLYLRPATNTQRPANSVFESSTIYLLYSTIIDALFVCPHRRLFLGKQCH